jgi:hypothetical protein
VYRAEATGTAKSLKVKLNFVKQLESRVELN